jgi:hypothetical protein
MSRDDRDPNGDIDFIVSSCRYEDVDRLTDFLRDNPHKLVVLRRIIDTYKNYFGQDAVLKLRVRPHGEENVPRRSLLVHIYAERREDAEGGPIIESFIEREVKGVAPAREEPELDRILLQARPMSQVGEVFETYEKGAP